MNTNVWRKITILVTFVMIIFSSVIMKQNWIYIVPLCVSLVVMYLQADVNRYGYLLGAINSVYYGVVYISFGIYAGAVSAFLVSFPLQLVTFFNWKKHACGNSVMLKKMSAKMRILVLTFLLVIWLTVFFVLKSVGSLYAVLDNTVTITGIACSILTLLAYIEYAPLWLINSCLVIFLNIQLVSNEPTQLSYLIYSLYCMYCTIVAYINVMKLYRAQNN